MSRSDVPRVFLAGGLALTFLLPIGCETSPPPMKRYVVAPEPPQEMDVRTGLRIRVEPFTAEEDGFEIAWVDQQSRAIGRYLFHRWSQRPSHMVTAAIAEGLRATHAFDSVDTAGSSRADVIVRGTVSELSEVRDGAEAFAQVRVLAVVSTVGEAAGVARHEVPIEVVHREPMQARLETDRKHVVAAGAASGAASVVGPMEKSLQVVVADLCAEIVAAATIVASPAASSDRLPDRGPATLDLTLPAFAAVGQRAGMGARVERFSAVGAVDHLDVNRRVARHRLEPLPDLRWSDRPARVVENAVFDALLASGAFPSVVRSEWRPSVQNDQKTQADLVVGGAVRRFEVDPAAEVPMVTVQVDLMLRAGVTSLEGVAALRGTDADAVAEAFALALGEVASAAVQAVIAVAESSRRDEQTGGPQAPAAPRAAVLNVQARSPVLAGEAMSGTVRIAPLDAADGINRPEVMLFTDGSMVSVAEGMSWHQHPPGAVRDALARSLGDAGVFGGGVLDTSSTKLPDYELRGRVEAFHLTREVGRLEASVGLTLELSERGADGILMFEAAGSAPVASLAPEDVVAGMNEALTRAVGIVIARVRAGVQG